jgi:PAS domain S-box-containing protein
MPDSAGRANQAEEIRQLRRLLQQRGNLLGVVSDIAGQMLEAHDWRGIEESMRRLGECTDVQRVSIFMNRTDETGLRRASLRHEWVDPSVKSQIDNPVWQDMHLRDLGLEHWVHLLEAGEPVASCLSELDDHQREIFVSQGIFSLACVPIVVQGHWWGTLVFDDYHTVRSWTEAELDALQITARLLSSFIMRQRNERSLIESEARYRNIVQMMPDLIWQADESMRILSVQTSNPELLIAPPDQLVGRILTELLPPDIAALTEQKCRDAFASDTMQIYDNTLDVLGGLREFETRLLPCADRTLLAIVRDVTKARESERELRQSEARLRSIVQALPDFIFRIDDRMRFIDVQASQPERLYVPIEQALGRTAGEILPPDGAALAEEHFAAAFATGAMQVYDYVLDVGGELNQYEIRIVPCADRELLAIVRDVTEARWAERELRRSEARFRSIVQALPDFIFRIDDRMRFTDVQAAHPGHLSATPEQFIGRTPAEVLSPDAAALAERHFAAAFASGTLQVFDFTLDIRGDIRDYESRLVPCADRELLAIVRDVTEAREAERELRRSEARYAAVVNDQTEMICRFSADSVLTFVNDAYCRFFGKTEEELRGNMFMPLIPQEDHDLVFRMLSSLNSAQPHLVYEHRVFNAKGEVRWVEWSDRAIMDDHGGILEYQSVGRDVTERKDLQRRLMESVENEQKRLSRELHDGLCQELKSLEIEAALLENQLDTAPDAAAAMASGIGRRANQAVRSAYDIVKGMLPVGLDAKGLAQALAALVDRSRAQFGGRITCSLRDDLQPIDTHQAGHLYRIAQEALGNALRHAQAGEIILSWNLDGDAAVLSVRDDGVGFDPSRPRWMNAGVGLTVIESRAHAIGAHLRIDSEPRSGTEIRCFLTKWRLGDRRAGS